MNYNIPLSYNLNIKELIENYNYTKNTNELIIDNFKLYINKNNIIYKISSNISIEYLLDFLNSYQEILIKKIYYFLIIKYLLKLNFSVNYKYFYNFTCFSLYEAKWFDKLIRTRQYHITYNNSIIITDLIKYNICLIIINNTNNKRFISIIDNNTLLDSLYIILENNIYTNNRYEDINIIIIGGKIEEVNIIINIYNILKNLKISKYIYKTYLFNNKPLNRIKFNTIKNTIKFILDKDFYYSYGDDNSNHINNNNFYCNLHRI